MTRPDEDNSKLSIEDNELALLENFCNLRSAQDQVLWSIFGAFWGTNALLLVSIFAADERWKINLVSIFISLIGIIISAIWLIIQSRTLNRIEMYEGSIRKIEDYNDFPKYLRTFSIKPKKGIKARTAMKWSVLLAMIGWIINIVCLIGLQFLCYNRSV